MATFRPGRRGRSDRQKARRIDHGRAATNWEILLYFHCLRYWLARGCHGSEPVNNEAALKNVKPPRGFAPRRWSADEELTG